MRIVIDGCATPNELSGDDATLVAALAAARAHAGERFIIEVFADGIPIPAQDLESPPDFAPYAEEISFRTVDRSTIIHEALESVDAALASIAAQHDAVAASLQTGRTAEAMNELSVVLGTWDSVQQLAATLAGLEAASAQSPEREGAAVELGHASDALLQIMYSVKEAVLSEDWSALADILSFDLTELASRWQASLNQFRAAFGH